MQESGQSTLVHASVAFVGLDTSKWMIFGSKLFFLGLHTPKKNCVYYGCKIQCIIIIIYKLYYLQYYFASLSLSLYIFAVDEDLSIISYILSKFHTKKALRCSKVLPLYSSLPMNQQRHHGVPMNQQQLSWIQGPFQQHNLLAGQTSELRQGKKKQKAKICH